MDANRRPNVATTAQFTCRAFPRRTAGVLLHITALQGHGPVGSLGAEAKRFVDFLHAAGFSWWQVCPIGPTGYGDSPYQALSVFASNPYLLDLADLVKRGLLKPEEVAPLQRHGDENTDYGRLWEQLRPLLKTAAHRGATLLQHDQGFLAYCKREASWLTSWQKFSALREKHQFAAPAQWTDLVAPNSLQIEAAVLQFLFQQQWQELRAYAQQRGVTLFGDEPIYVSADGCDAKFHPELFQLDDAGAPTAVAGVPPDYFAADGQLWGNPLYRWERHQADQFSWWRSRIQHDLTFFDAIRIDHFRGLHDFWSVPAGSPNARQGQWCAGPDLAFTQAVGDLPLVAEDLGLLSPGVEVLRRASGLPGMSVLQFGFGEPPEGNPHYPDNITPDRVVYTGTHDNDTVVGWYKQLSDIEKSTLHQLYGDLAQPHLHFAEVALNSPAIAAFIPAQDLLGLDENARFNTPGNPQGNWTWRLTNVQFETLMQAAPAWKQRLQKSQRLSESNDGI
jgi:4-alpha-glucanotransferase